MAEFSIPDKRSDDCGSFNDSYVKNVVIGRNLIRQGEEKQGIRYFKRHLKCFNDKNVYKELAEYYITKKKYYLAGLTYKEAGMIDEYNETEKLKLNIGKKEKKHFLQTSSDELAKYNRKYRDLRNFTIASIVIGSISSATGLSLFIHDNVFNGTNSKIAQYSLIFGGLYFISSGITSDAFAHLALDRAEAYRYVSENIDEIGTDPNDYYRYSGTEAQIKYNNSKRLTIHGTALILVSIPMFAFSIYSFFESYNYLTTQYQNEKEENTESLEESDGNNVGTVVGSIALNVENGIAYKHKLLYTHFAQSFLFVPAIASLTGGIIMLVKASKWKKLDTKESVLVLNSITPVIDPVSKTYGFNLGFSF